MVCTAQTSSPSANPSAAPSHLFQQRKGFLTLIYDPLSWALTALGSLAPKAVGFFLEEPVQGDGQAGCLPCSGARNKRPWKVHSAFREQAISLVSGTAKSHELGALLFTVTACCSPARDRSGTMPQGWGTGPPRPAAKPLWQQLSRSRAVTSAAARCWHLCLSGVPSPAGCSEWLGSAFTADRQRHICDLFLVLTRITYTQSFNFRSLSLKMRLMIVLGSPIQRINFINTCKILQKTAWGWPRVIWLITCTLTYSLRSQVCFRSGAEQPEESSSVGKTSILPTRTAVGSI